MATPVIGIQNQNIFDIDGVFETEMQNILTKIQLSGNRKEEDIQKQIDQTQERFNILNIAPDQFEAQRFRILSEAQTEIEGKVVDIKAVSQLLKDTLAEWNVAFSTSLGRNPTESESLIAARSMTSQYFVYEPDYKDAEQRSNVSDSGYYDESYAVNRILDEVLTRKTEEVTQNPYYITDDLKQKAFLNGAIDAGLIQENDIYDLAFMNNFQNSWPNIKQHMTEQTSRVYGASESNAKKLALKALQQEGNNDEKLRYGYLTTLGTDNPLTPEEWAAKKQGQDLLDDLDDDAVDQILKNPEQFLRNYYKDSIRFPNDWNQTGTTTQSKELFDNFIKTEADKLKAYSQNLLSQTDTLGNNKYLATEMVKNVQQYLENNVTPSRPDTVSKDRLSTTSDQALTAVRNFISQNFGPGYSLDAITEEYLAQQYLRQMFDLDFPMPDDNFFMNFPAELGTATSSFEDAQAEQLKAREEERTALMESDRAMLTGEGIDPQRYLSDSVYRDSLDILRPYASQTGDSLFEDSTVFDRLADPEYLKSIGQVDPNDPSKKIAYGMNPMGSFARMPDATYRDPATGELKSLDAPDILNNLDLFPTQFQNIYQYTQGLSQDPNAMFKQRFGGAPPSLPGNVFGSIPSWLQVATPNAMPGAQAPYAAPLPKVDLPTQEATSNAETPISGKFLPKVSGKFFPENEKFFRQRSDPFGGGR